MTKTFSLLVFTFFTSSYSFALDSKSLFCSSDSASSTVLINLKIDETKEATGDYVYSSSGSSLGLGFSFSSLADDNGVYVISNSERRLISLKESSLGQWVVYLVLKDSGVGIFLPCEG